MSTFFYNSYVGYFAKVFKWALFPEHKTFFIHSDLCTRHNPQLDQCCMLQRT